MEAATPMPPADTATEKAPMDALVIQGGRRLSGRVAISGAKNAALPVMAATLIAPGVHKLRNVPDLRDTRTFAAVLGKLGAKVRFEGDLCTIDTTHVSSVEAPYELVKTMRASIYVLGPLLARLGGAKVSLPGGCAWGPRPVNLHLAGLAAMGANLEIEHGYIVGRDVKLHGTHFTFDIVSVGATAQLMMAAVTAQGTTVLDNVAIEPDITVLGEVLGRLRRAHRRPGHAPARHPRRARTEAHRHHDHPRPHRGRHVRSRGGDHRRQHHVGARGPRPLRGRTPEARGGRWQRRARARRSHRDRSRPSRGL
jgi:hypothetical protein